MGEVIKETKNHMDIYDYKDENYMTVLRFGHWRVAYLNHGDKFIRENFTRVERHLLTDEAFILLEGDATLITGEDLKETKMEPHKVYNIPKAEWHHIITTPGTRVLIVENEETGPMNSEYMDVK